MIMIWSIVFRDISLIARLFFSVFSHTHNIANVRTWKRPQLGFGCWAGNTSPLQPEGHHCPLSESLYFNFSFCIVHVPFNETIHCITVNDFWIACSWFSVRVSMQSQVCLFNETSLVPKGLWATLCSSSSLHSASQTLHNIEHKLSKNTYTCSASIC